jgi:hypothetical protein
MQAIGVSSDYDRKFQVQNPLNVEPKLLCPADFLGKTDQVMLEGRAIAQAVSSWLPTAAARVQDRI